MSSLRQFTQLNLKTQKKVKIKEVEEWAKSLWKLHTPRDRELDTKDGKPFVIMYPPPNITGNLHLGHTLTGALQDAIVRQRRMMGQHCLFIPGFDHAGIATQGVVEKLIWKKQGVTRKQLGREKFLELVNEWKENKRAEMRGQLNRLGLDLDHDREYFTMDENSSKTVHEAFKILFNSGLIYRSVKPIFWSKQLDTTLSDIEVEEVDGVNRFFRTGEIVERRPLHQWFIDTNAMAHKAVEVVNNGSIAMIPSNYKNSWYSWLVGTGIEDWCISRQIWWGHQIPAYKLKSTPDVKESWVVADSLEEARSLLGSCDEEIVQDPDVLDTWFSSSLLPLTVSGWPDRTKFKENCDRGYFPLQMMETGFDILTFWVSKMAMISLALTDMIPFNLVLLHGMICDSNGKKMSKTLGNVIDPLDVIDGASLEDLQDRTRESHSNGIIDDRRLEAILENQKKLFPRGIPSCGADGLRAYLLSHDVQEEVVRIRIEQIEKIRRLTNKLWNIFRFALPHIENLLISRQKLAHDVSELEISELSDADRNVLEHLALCVTSANESFTKTFQLQHCFNDLELFWTIHLSQTYIEKIRLILQEKEGTSLDKKRSIEVLYICLDTANRILHPFMPHLTEFFHQNLQACGRKDADPSDLDDIKNVMTQESFPNPIDWKRFITDNKENL